MPGVKIVEEPTDDLWFPPDQCVVPEEAAEALAQAGYMGIGDYYDPMPWMPVDDEYGQLIRRMRELPFPSAEVEQEQAERWAEEQAWRKDLPALYRDAPRQVIEDIENKVFYLSFNAKTGHSFNIRIAGYKGIWGMDEREERLHRAVPGTCVPTEWCLAHCYAKTGHFVTWDKEHWYDLSRQQARYLQNLIVSHLYAKSSDEEIEAQADAIYEAIRGKFYTSSGDRSDAFPLEAPVNLRWNGGGDFNPGTTRIVNMLTERHPDMVVWGFTRKADTAGSRHSRGLEPRPNLVVNVSLDPATPWGETGGKRGFSLDDLVDAALRLRGNLVYATHIIMDPRIAQIRSAIRKRHGDELNVNTVFGYHCSALHTTIGDAWECSATNPRIYGYCQECRWCMMSRAQRLAEGVATPNQAYFRHGFEPDYERIEKENRAIRDWNDRHPDEPERPEIMPMEEEEVWG